jgi:hypothetical protein
VARAAIERDVAFSQPVRQISLMLTVMAAVGVIGWLLARPIATVFQSSVYLNAVIAGVFVIGVVACFRAVAQMVSCVSWIEGFTQDRPGHEFAEPPGLLAPLAAVLRDARARSAISATSARSILDSVGDRLDERRDITRYIANLLIFLGLLGTFWGLSNTVPAVVDTIRSLAPGEGDQSGAAVFGRLMTGLEDQLGGMGTAFATSLMGLAGSLVIGLLELFVGHAQNRFHRELEEWLSTITRVGFDPDAGAGEIAVGLVERTGEQIGALSRLIEQAEAGRAAEAARLSALTEAVGRLAAGLETRGRGAETALLERIAAGLEARPGADGARQTALLERIAATLETRAAGEGEPLEADAEVRARIRNIDRHLLRMLEEMAVGREDAVAALRAELAAVTRAVAALSDAARR